MEKTSKKPVDRQATFDTDPNRANLAQGNLKLPIIEAQELEKIKSGLKENRNNQAKPKQSENSSSDHKENNLVSDSKKEITDKDKDTKATVTAVKTSESDRKTNILSNINKKVVNGAERENKDIRTSKDASSKDESDKNTRKTNGVHKNDKTTVGHAEQKSGIGVKSNDTIKSNSLNKVNDSKTLQGNSKTETSQKTRSNKNKLEPHTNKKESATESTPKVNESRSRSPEKQPSKAAVLNNLNHKRSISPVKGKDTSPLKESNSSNKVNNSETKNQTVKTVAIKSPQNKAATNINDKGQKLSPRKQTNANKSENAPHKVEIKSPSNKTNNKQNQPSVVKETKNTKATFKSALPANNAPVETHLLASDRTEKKSVTSSPRTKPPDEKQSPENQLKKKESETKHHSPEYVVSLPDKTTKNVEQSNNSLTEAPLQLDNFEASNSQNNQLNKQDTEQRTNDQNPEKLSTDSHVASNGQKAVVNLSPERDLNTSVKSKNETYVLSPSPTKVDTRSPKSNKVSRPGRLSPSNESVEPIKLEQRPAQDKQGTGMDRKESYAVVYAERNTLLNAEYTYRKRIKQLEDEANGFLKAIDELTTENKYLRNRVDILEDELRNKGDSKAIDKISELEKTKLILEEKITQLEKSSQSSNTGELRTLKEQIVKLQSDNQTLNEENLKLKSENYENTKKLHAMESEKKSLQTSVTDVESEKLGKIKDLSNEQKHLNKQMQELKNKNQGLEKKVNALEFENKTLSETLTQKKTELGELLGVMKDENKFDEELRNLKNEILKLNKEKKETELAHTKEKRVLNEKLKDVKTSLDTKSKYVDELKIKLDQVESEHQKMKSDFDPMKKLVDSQKKEIARLKEENERLKQELKESKEAYSKIENETESASKDLKEAKEQLEQFNKDLQNIVNDKESQISKLINQLDTMRQERENERKTAKEEKEKLASEIEKVESYQETTRRLEADVKNFTEKLDDSKLKEKQLSLQLEDRSFEVSNLEHQVFEMNMKMENYSKRMSDLDREKREMEREKREWEVKKDKMDDIESSNKRLLEENKRLRSQIEMSSYASTYRSSERPVEEKPVVEAWVSEKGHTHAINHAIYVQKEREREHRKKRVHLAQPSIQKTRKPFSKSSPVKVSRQHRQEEHKPSNPSTHRSLEDLRKVGDSKSPESENSLPELKQDARLTIGYGNFGGYREIHKNRIRAAHKRVY